MHTLLFQPNYFTFRSRFWLFLLYFWDFPFWLSLLFVLSLNTWSCNFNTNRFISLFCLCCSIFFCFGKNSIQFNSTDTVIKSWKNNHFSISLFKWARFCQNDQLFVGLQPFMAQILMSVLFKEVHSLKVLQKKFHALTRNSTLSTGRGKYKIGIRRDRHVVDICMKENLFLKLLL